MSTRVQNDFSLQFRDSFFNSFIFDKSDHVCFRIMKTKARGKGGEGRGGGAVYGRERNCRRNNELSLKI